jgi:hypothetical protein
MAPSSSLPPTEEENILPDILPNELAELEEEDDDEEDVEDDDDDDDDDEEEEPQYQDNISTLEEHLSQVTEELTAIRNERETQRVQQLEPLAKDHHALNTQKDLRIERMKLQEQLDELQATIDAKLLVQKHQVEDLEQVKSHYRQLQRTCKLLQGSVEQILEQSASDIPKGLEARNRATMRQALLKQLLQQDYKSQLSLFSNADDRHDDDDDSDDDDDDDGAGPQLFHKKNKRYDSIDSMMSQIDHTGMMSSTAASYQHRNKFPSHTTTTTSSEGGRSLSRSKFYQIEDQQQKQKQQQQPRRHSLSSQGSTGSGGVPRRKQSKSSSRSSSSGSSSKVGRLRRSKSFDASTTTSASRSTTTSSTRRKTSLMRLLDQGNQGYDHQDDDEDGSQDTPRTTNTQGTR